MAVLSAADRKAMPAKDFAGPGRSFPVGDATHARMAISGATRSEHAGNISSSEEVAIKAKARAKLGDKGGEDHKSAVAKMHPAHVHKLVQDAHAGKYGPQAQHVAQMATQPQQGAMPPQDGDADDTGAAPAGADRSAMFSSGASPAAAAPPQPANRASMFQGR
jgi:hypothetical protein